MKHLCLILLWSLFGIAIILQAQETGSITGTVRDHTGAVMPGAEVTITNVAQGLARKVTTNGGDYLVAGLPPGTYDLQIAAKGFERCGANGIVLRVAQKARADATSRPNLP